MVVYYIIFIVSDYTNDLPEGINEKTRFRSLILIFNSFLTSHVSPSVYEKRVV